MSTFIQEVVRDLNAQNINFANLVFILPSKRAGAFLQNAIASELTKTIYSPDIYSIEEFVEHISGLQLIPTIELIFKFYEIYLEHTPLLEQESFNNFITWAQTVLDDLNEIDRHLLDPSSIFDYLKNIQELNHWSNTAPTDLIKRYLFFWEKLPLYYYSLKENLLSQNEGYQGLLYKKASDEIEFYIQNNKSKHHVFLGFNALNTSEENIIQALLADTKGHIYWDAETSFMNPENHNASLFLKKHKEKWRHFVNHDFKWESNNYPEKKKITTTSVQHDIDQVKYVAHILKSLDKETLSKTAVVLGDEGIIIPLLNSLPNNIQEVNITMGIPLNQTPIATFFESLFSLQLGASDKGYYYKNVLDIITHPLSVKLFHSSEMDSLSHNIITNNIIYVKAESIVKSSNPIIAASFSTWSNEDIKSPIQAALKIINYLLKTISYKTDSLLIAYLERFRNVYTQLDLLCSSYSYIKEIKTLHRFYKDIVSKETVDVKGSPYKGLQIMGMLESRLLDFENVIITSVNEGVLPSGKSSNSFLPYDLKLHYGLPTYTEKDAVYTYHFYRLLHRAQNVDLIYTTTASGLGAAEKSRLLLQLETEGIHEIKHQIATPEILPSSYKEITIHKTSSVQEKIKCFLQSGISPSAIGTYLRNPLDFYYQYILGVPRQDSLEETIAANTMGTIIHNVLEALYTPHINKKITKSDLEKMAKTYRQHVDIEFQSSRIKGFNTGKNRIIYEVICRFIENFVKSEIRDINNGAVLHIKSLENKLKTTLTVASLPYPVTLKGTVDRVDHYNNQLRIIDYKTGTVNPGDLKIKEWQDLLQAEGKYEKAFQVLLYTYMITTSQSTTLPAQAGIISTKKIKNGFMPFTFVKDQLITQDTLTSFETILLQLLQEIINPEIPFRDSGFTY